MGQTLFWLLVIKAVSWKGRDYAVGDEIQLPLGAAYKLITRRCAKKIAGPSEPSSEQPTEQTARRRRQKKAALVAPVDPAPVAAPPVESAAEAEPVDPHIEDKIAELYPAPTTDAPAPEPEQDA